MLRINEDEEEVEYNKGQAVLQRVLRFSSGLAPVMMATMQLSAEESFPVISSPYKQIISAFAVNGCILASDMLRSCAIEEKPFAYLKKVGDGSIVAGLRKKAAIIGISFIPPLAAATAYGLALNKVCEDAQQEGNIDRIIVCSMLEGPAINLFLVGLPAWALYGITKKLIECCRSIPAKTVKEHPQTKLLQDLLYAVFCVTDSLLQAELLRQVVLIFSPSLMHLSFAPLLPAMLNQVVLNPLNYLAFQAKPIKNLVPPECQPQHSDEYYNQLIDKPEFNRNASTCHRTKIYALYMASASVALAITAGVHYLLIDQVMEDRDPESMPEGKRIGYVAGLLAGCFLINKTINAAPGLIKRFGNWCSGMTLFGKSPVEEVSKDEELGLTTASI